MDAAVARALAALFGDGRAPGGHEDRHIVAPGVDEAHQRVGAADIHMRHNGGHPARRLPVAVRHADRHGLMHDGVGRGEVQPRLPGPRIGLDDGREVGARIGEQHIDPARLEQRQISLGDGDF